MKELKDREATLRKTAGAAAYTNSTPASFKYLGNFHFGLAPFPLDYFTAGFYFF